MSKCPDCSETSARLASYVDGTLSPLERDAVEQHLRGCAPCRMEAHEEGEARTILRDCRSRLSPAAAPPQLRARCEALARAQCGAMRGTRQSSAVLFGVAAGLILVTAAAIAYVATQRSNTVLAAQLSRDHANCFSNLTSAPAATDAAAIEQMFESRYGWDVHVPPSSAAAGVQLLEGRRCLLAYGGVPHLLYRVNGHNVSLYVFEGATRSDGDVSMFGNQTLVWSRGANSFALVSSAPTAEVSRAIAYVRAEVH